MSEIAARSVVELQLSDELSFDDWLDIGRQLHRAAEGVMWWIGDWWAYGTHKYGERARAVRDDPALPAFQTCVNAGVVARAFETNRRRFVLSWSHHQEVAALDPVDQERYLDLAQQQKLSKNKLRQVIKADQRDVSTNAIKLRVPVDIAGVEMRHQDALELLDSLPDGCIDLLLTDPPYCVTDNEWDVWEDEDTYWKFMADWLSLARQKMALEFTALIFCDADASPRLAQTLDDTGWPVLRQVIWHRPNLAKKRSGSLTFLSSYEPVWHCGNRALNLPIEWGDERFDVQSVVVPQSNHINDTAYHPTQKPLELIRRLVRVGSYNNEFVVDPFCGSGTTAVACRDEDRRCLTGDTSEEYLQIARGRLA